MSRSFTSGYADVNPSPLSLYKSLSNFFSLLNILNIKRKSQLLLCLFLGIISSLAEAFSLLTLIPFVKILLNPVSLNSYSIFSTIIEKLLIVFPAVSLSFAILFAFILVAGISAIIKISNQYISSRVMSMVSYDYSHCVFSEVLMWTYQQHLQTNSSKVLALITSNIRDVVSTIRLFLEAINSLALTLILLGFFMLSNPVITLSIVLVTLASYSLILSYSKKSYDRISHQAYKLNSTIIKIIGESLGDIREIILENNIQPRVKQFRRTSLPLKLNNSRMRFLKSYPKYILEFESIALLSCLCFYFISIGSDESTLLTQLGIIVFASTKILPAIQTIFNFVISLKGTAKATEAVHSIFCKIKQGKIKHEVQKLEFDQISSIHFESVRFKYHDSSQDILKGVSFEIRSGQIIGIKGRSGSGKSTLIDLFLGLLYPTSGKIYFNNDISLLLNEQSLSYWQSLITCVSQSIYAYDDSFASNISMCSSEGDIDWNKLNRVCEIAEIKDLIESLPNKYETRVGENGSLLSGGEKQRLGIARALYKSRPIIVLDEATSALDQFTESKIIKNIFQFNPNATIVMIAHRLNTLIDCDLILELENGDLCVSKNG